MVDRNDFFDLVISAAFLPFQHHTPMRDRSSEDVWAVNTSFACKDISSLVTGHEIASMMPVACCSLVRHAGVE